MILTINELKDRAKLKSIDSIIIHGLQYPLAKEKIMFEVEEVEDEKEED